MYARVEATTSSQKFSVDFTKKTTSAAGKSQHARLCLASVLARQPVMHSSAAAAAVAAVAAVVVVVVRSHKRRVY